MTPARSPSRICWLTVASSCAEAPTSALLFDALEDFPPMGLLVNETMQKAQPVSELGGVVFPGIDASLADQAVTTLVALGSVARPNRMMRACCPVVSTGSSVASPDSGLVSTLSARNLRARPCRMAPAQSGSSTPSLRSPAAAVLGSSSTSLAVTADRRMPAPTLTIWSSRSSCGTSKAAHSRPQPERFRSCFRSTCFLRNRRLTLSQRTSTW